MPRFERDPFPDECAIRLAHDFHIHAGQGPLRALLPFSLHAFDKEGDAANDIVREIQDQSVTQTCTTPTVCKYRENGVCKLPPFLNRY